ncbi:MAG: EthD family reductase [Dehalococcoidia bacterium]
MITMTMVYQTPAGDDQFFDEAKYHEHYVPVALQIAGKYRCQSVKLSRTIANREGEPGGVSIYRITQFVFPSLDDAKAFVFSPERTKLGETSRRHFRSGSEVFYTEDETYQYDSDGQLIQSNGPGSDTVMAHPGWFS